VENPARFLKRELNKFNSRDHCKILFAIKTENNRKKTFERAKKSSFPCDSGRKKGVEPMPNASS
jgi:hypothetical protein